MQKINLALVYGGDESEHQISVLSFKNIYYNINKKKYNIIEIFIAKSGLWYLDQDLICFYPGDGIFCKDKKLKIDLAFLILHGKNGEDGKIQGILDLCNVKYTGSDVLSSSIAFNKIIAKKIVSLLKIPVVPFLSFDKNDDILQNPKKYKEKLQNLSYPLFLKPSSLGSSVGTQKIENDKNIISIIEEKIEKYNQIIIEKFIRAYEFECSVIQVNGEVLCPNVGQASFDEEKYKYYDYKAKYDMQTPSKTSYDTQIISSSEKEKLKSMSKKIFKACMCKGFARIDFLKDKNSGIVYFSEINTIPGFTKTSLFSDMLKNLFSYEELIDTIINQALNANTF